MRRAGNAGMAAFTLLLALSVPSGNPAAAQAQEAGKELTVKNFDSSALPLVRKYCLECHSTSVKKGDLDLQRFGAPDDLRKDVKPNRRMCSLFLSLMDKSGVRLPNFGDSKERLAEI